MELDQFRSLLSRLTPRPSSSRRCIQWLQNFNGDFAVPFKVFLEVMQKGSLNARARLLHLLETALGLAGNCHAPEGWTVEVTSNIQKVVDAAVPAHLAPAALINLRPTMHMVSRLKRANKIDQVTSDRILDQLKAKATSLESLAAMQRPSNFYASKDEVLRRMEDDRERSKAYKKEIDIPELGSDAEFEQQWEHIGPHPLVI